MKKTKHVSESQQVALLQRTVDDGAAVMGLMRERLAELELAFENQGWQRMTGYGKWEFTREFLKQIVAFARLMFIKNPLIRRSVQVQKYYVWGLGVTITCAKAEVTKVIRSFFDDKRNRDVVGTKQARGRLEEELQITGNLFFIFFRNRITGVVRVRTIDVDEIVDIKCNPEDANEPWFYRRSYTTQNGDAQTVWYPDWNHHPKVKETSIDKHPVEWDTPVYHVKEGGVSRMRFGVPEVYSSLDWAMAYKTFLEDWATIMRAYARLAMQVSGVKGKARIAATKNKLNTSISSTSDLETNPPGDTASWLVTPPGTEIKAIKTAGSTTSAEEGRPLRLMVASGVGLPDTFLGDVDAGNYATSQTLDRPTELKMVDRQSLWQDILANISMFVVESSAKAPQGKLRSVVQMEKETDGFDGSTSEVATVDGEPVEITVEFPNILERNATERMRAVVGGLTMLGKPIQDVIWDKRLCAKLILEALGERNVVEVLDRLYPPNEVHRIEPPPPPVAPTPGAPGEGVPAVKKGKGSKKDAVDSK